MVAKATPSRSINDDRTFLKHRIVANLGELIDVVAATTFAAGISLDQLNSTILASLMKQAEKDGMDTSEIATRLERCSSWCYDKARNIRTPALDDDSLFVEERIIDFIASGANGKTISELAIQLGKHEKALLPLCDALVRKGHLTEIPKTAPQRYNVIENSPQFVHKYPADQYGLLCRRERAEVVVEHARESMCLTEKARLSDFQSQKVFRLFRNYELSPYLECVLNQLHADTKRRGKLPDHSTFGAVLAFSPSDGERGPIAHYRQCYKEWQNKTFEILPYRYALDAIAIQEFESVHLKSIVDDFRSLLTSPKAANAKCYQLSLVWGVLP